MDFASKGICTLATILPRHCDAPARNRLRAGMVRRGLGICGFIVTSMSGCLAVSSCATQPTRAHLDPTADIVVLNLGIPSKPHYYEAADPMNLVPLVNWAYPAHKDAELGSALRTVSPPLEPDCGQAMFDALQGRSLKPTLALADRSTTLGVPQLLSKQQLQSVAGSGFVVDWVIARYGFTAALGDNLEATMIAVAQVYDADSREIVYRRRLFYNPGILEVSGNDLELDRLPGSPSWKDWADLQAHLPDAADALMAVCREIASVVASEVT